MILSIGHYLGGVDLNMHLSILSSISALKEFLVHTSSPGNRSICHCPCGVLINSSCTKRRNYLRISTDRLMA